MVMNWIDELVWSWHVKQMRGLLIKVAWYWYETHFYIHGLRMMSWYGFNLEYERGWL